MKVICALDGDKMKPSTEYRPRKGGNGLGVNYGGGMYTLTAADRHMVALSRKVICVNFMGSKGNSIATVERSPSILRMHGNDVHVVTTKKSSNTPLTSPADDATICADPKRWNLAGKTKVRVVLYHPIQNKEKRK